MSKWLPPGRGGYRPKPSGIENPKPPKGSAGASRIHDLIEASSLGTPEAKALRESVSDETVRRVVARAEELRREAGDG